MDVGGTGSQKGLTRVRTHGAIRPGRHLVAISGIASIASLRSHVDWLTAEMGGRVRGAGNVRRQNLQFA